jgi:hypothetical protein
LTGVIKPYRNGKDLTQSPRNVWVVDFFGFSDSEALSEYPSVYQWILDRVKPERDQNKRESRRKNWWLFGETNPKLRDQLSDIDRYVVTVETAKHRVFQFLQGDILPDNKLVNIALENGNHLGLMGSRVHMLWALTAGGNLGVGNDPVYVKSRCFETFPFPDLSGSEKEKLAARIGQLAEQIDQHRKTQQAAHDKLTLTGIYNVLEKLRKSEPLNAKEKTIYDDGLVGILRELHDELDRAVFEAYGWSDLADKLVGLPGATTPYPEKSDAQADAEEELLKRLVALNHERAMEEQNGQVRWLRPDYQNPDYQNSDQGKESATDSESMAQLEADVTAKPVATKAKKLTWPKSMPEQVAAVKTALQDGLESAEAITALYKSPKSTGPKVQEVLESLESLGYAHREAERYRLVG